LRNIKADEGTTEPYTEDQFDRILSAIEKYPVPKNVDGMTRNGFKDRMRGFCQLLRWSGLSINDAVDMKRTELLLDEKTGYHCVDVDRNKTGEPVYVPIPPDVVEQIKNISPERGVHPAYFFRNPYNKLQSDVHRWQLRFNRLFEIADLKTDTGEPLTVHSRRLRKTFSVRALETGVRLEHVSRALGHAKLATTQRAYEKWVDARRSIAVQDLAASWVKQRNVVNIQKVKRQRANA
jgi:integrase